MRKAGQAQQQTASKTQQATEAHSKSDTASHSITEQATAAHSRQTWPQQASSRASTINRSIAVNWALLLDVRNTVHKLRQIQLITETNTVYNVRQIQLIN